MLPAQSSPRRRWCSATPTRGLARRSNRNSAGFYRFSALGPGHYKVVVSAPGFATVTQENIDLTGDRVQEVTRQASSRERGDDRDCYRALRVQ